MTTSTRNSLAALILVVALFIASFFLLNRDSDTVDTTSETPTREITISNNSAPTPVNVATTTRYQTYSADNLETSDSTTKVLFFKASWCTTCAALDRDIEANVQDIPADWVIYEVDYDTEEALKEQYRVATQHTLVYLDEDNDQTAKWSALLSLDDVIAAAQV